MKTLNNEQVKKLALDLMRADTEADVIEILKTAGFWEDMNAWRIFGDNENNYSTIGNQQATPEAAIVEKLINCVDARLILECLLAGINPEDADHAPKTIREAVARFFEKNPNPTSVLAGRVGEWQDSRRTEVARGITFAATGYGTKEGKPSFTISDCGEGQTPQRMPDTLLAYNRSNKLRTAFVQGKFNMGGTGVLKFCGKHNLQLIITRRHPDLVKNSKDSSDREWGVTVIRRDELKGPVRNTVYMYLAPLNADQRPSKGDVLHFAADTLPIFPEGREAYVRHSAWGTLIKLYEYTTTGSRTNVILKDGMMHRLRILLPEVALPIRFHECRTSFRGHSGSFDTNLSGLMVLLNDEKQKNLEEGYPLQRPLRAGGEEMTATIYAFKKDRGDTYKKREGIIFTINGQTHGSLTKEFFHRKAAGRLGYIADSILVIVDCTRFSNRSREDFIMNSRDRLSGGDLRTEIEQALEDLLKECKELQELRERRQLEATSEILADEKPLEEILTKLLKQSPTLSALFLRGTRIPNPFNLTKTKVMVKGPFKGKEHPTYFRFRDKAAGTELVRNCAENFRCALSFETDATDDYFTRTVDAGKRMVYRVAGDQRVPVESFNGPFLDKGEATLRVKLPPNAELGDALSYVLVVEDTLRDEPFENRFTINVTAAVTPKPGKPGKKKEKKDKDEDIEHEIEVESGMSLPRIIPIHEDKWEAQEPPFNRYTALRIQISSVPGNGDGQDVYDYLINMDNLYLKAEEKNAKEDLKLLQARYQYGLVLLGLALVNDDAQDKKRKEGAEDPAPEDREEDAIETRVEHITRAIAPVLLPMINQLGSIELDMPVVIDDSGEAA